MTLRPIETSALRALLTRGTVHFAFRKLDGDLRMAVGTTNLSVIPVRFHPKGVRPSSPNVVTFFDIEKGEWRAISTRSEIFVHQ